MTQLASWTYSIILSLNDDAISVIVSIYSVDAYLRMYSKTEKRRARPMTPVCIGDTVTDTAGSQL